MPSTLSSTSDDARSASAKAARAASVSASLSSGGKCSGGAWRCVAGRSSTTTARKATHEPNAGCTDRKSSSLKAQSPLTRAARFMSTKRAGLMSEAQNVSKGTAAAATAAAEAPLAALEAKRPKAAPMTFALYTSTGSGVPAPSGCWASQRRKCGHRALELPTRNASALPCRPKSGSGASAKGFASPLACDSPDASRYAVESVDSPSFTR
mmetsp:Transcript_5402/g.10263  ORF Transcript_5402/g.10263 Transcript_5402/m.10263 type:complete len:210 (+) Transcript_5402:331-960(+)